MNHKATSPEIEIRRIINEHGKITFARFVEVALYHPKDGYYATPSAFGASGDYYTSATVHPAFGALLAMQLHRMWELLGQPNPFFAVELGAGVGQLAEDILQYSTTLPHKFNDSLIYITIDRYTQENRHYSRGNTWQPIISDSIPLKNIVGCVLSNELVDSFPFHRFHIEAGKVKEIFVSLTEHSEFIEVLDTPSTPEIISRLNQFRRTLPEGLKGEVNLNIQPWMKRVSGAIDRGFVITIDYGYDSNQMYSPNRPEGTYDTFYRHTRGGSPYQRIGRQDITAHVDFASLISEGQQVGLKTLSLLTQAEHLTNLGFGHMLELLRKKNISHQERQANMMGIMELIKPDGFGTFKVLVQEKGSGVSDINDTIPIESPTDVPLRKVEHTPVFEGRYPHQAMEITNLWPLEVNDETKP